MTKRGRVIAISAATLLIGARLLLPLALKTAVNSSLGRSPDHPGRIEDLDLHLWRGAIAFEGIRLLDPKHGPLFAARRIEVAIHWRSLLRGTIKARIHIQSPSLTLVKKAAAPDPAPLSLAAPVAAAKALQPIDIALLSVVDGDFRYRDPAHPGQDLFIDHLELKATDVSNRRRLAPVATLDAEGRLMGQGGLKVHARFDTLSETPHFDLEGRLRDFPLASIAGLIRTHGGVIVSSGTLDLFGEFAVKKDSFKGYLKPFLKDLAFAPKETKGMKMREMVMGEVALYLVDLLTNRRQDSVATKLEFSGRLDDPKVDPRAALEAAFRHAFIKALKPNVDHSVETELVKKKD